MSEDKQAAVVTGFTQRRKEDSVSAASDEGMTHIRGQGKAKAVGPKRERLMHQSTLSLGDQASGTCYITTHSQSYSGRTADGQVLLFYPRDPMYPSLHIGQLDLRNMPSTSQSQTHSRHVHSPKDVVPSEVQRSLGRRNWMLNREGVAMREVANPPEPTPYWTTYQSEHIGPDSTHPSQSPMGKPTLWHQHDIVTGKQRNPDVPGKTKRKSGDKVLWAVRRWETDCCSYRLY